MGFLKFCLEPWDTPFEGSNNISWSIAGWWNKFGWRRGSNLWGGLSSRAHSDKKTACIASETPLSSFYAVSLETQQVIVLPSKWIEPRVDGEKSVKQSKLSARTTCNIGGDIPVQEPSTTVSESNGQLLDQWYDISQHCHIMSFKPDKQQPWWHIVVSDVRRAYQQNVHGHELC